MAVSLDSFIDFIKLTNQFQKVERVVRIEGQDRWENDVEHSYQLAMAGWYLAEQLDLDLNRDLIVRFALVHDLVEIYAGDTFAYGEEAHLASKQEREEAAARQIEEEFPEFSSLHALIKEYEDRKIPEAKFVYALDKILPAINIYLDKGRTWQEKGITLAMAKKAKAHKVAQAPELAQLYEELMKLLEENSHFFAQENSLFN